MTRGMSYRTAYRLLSAAGAVHRDDACDPVVLYERVAAASTGDLRVAVTMLGRADAITWFRRGMEAP